MALLTDINNLTKKVYAKGGVTKLIPEESYCYFVKNIPFKESQKIGEKYVESLELSLSGGFTLLSPGAGKTTLNDGITMKVKKAEISAYQIFLSDNLLAEEVANTMKAGEKAFEKAAGLLHTNMMKSMSLMLESQFLYGRSGLGKITVDTAAEVTSTTATFNIDQKEFASGLYIGREGFKIHVYNDTDDALVSSGADAEFVIEYVDVEEREIKVSGTATGIDALVAAVTTNDKVCSVYWLNAHPSSSSYNEAAGIHKQITNTGDLFGIDAGDYRLFKGLEVDAQDAQISYDLIMRGVAKAVNRGLMQDVICAVNPVAWQKIADANAAQHQYTGNDKQVKGARKLEFVGINGAVKIIPHPMVKEGHAFILPKDAIKRIGGADVSFGMPGESNDYWFKDGNNNAFTTNLYTNQAIFLCKPNLSVLVHNFSV